MLAHPAFAPVPTRTPTLPPPATAPQGTLRIFRHRDGAPVTCRVYVPGGPLRPTRALVVVHGISRNAGEQIRLWKPFADENGFMIIAPLFSKRRFHGYQRLESDCRKSRPDQVLLQLLTWLEGTGLHVPARRVLFGHSGGAQFAHRFLLAHPHVFDAAILSSAGWYTWPTRDLKFPAGLRTGKATGATSPALHLEPFLHLPILVSVGELDTEPDAQLRSGVALDTLQGAHRVERAQRWVEALQRTSSALGIPPQSRIARLPKAGHPFAENMKAGLPRHALEFLRQIPWLWGRPSPSLRQVAAGAGS